MEDEEGERERLDLVEAEGGRWSFSPPLCRCCFDHLKPETPTIPVALKACPPRYDAGLSFSFLVSSLRQPHHFVVHLIEMSGGNKMRECRERDE
ncbi:hypothetical protein PIB30_095059, partial [Stylosanthes scabra]|nr:hypothetical protein [Stylosanthes scabra]